MMEAAAPGPGAVLAERLWCTIPRSRPVEAGNPGEVFTVRLADGVKVVAESWGDGPNVYLMHGWGGRRAQLDAFVGPLLWAGYRVVSLDAPGHGDSGPGAYGRGRGLLTEFADALRTVVSVGGPAHAVIAHSLGGSATGLAVLDGLPVRRLAFISPMADPMPYTFEFARTFGFGERIRQGFLRRLEARVGRRMKDFDILTRADRATAALPPVLVVHDPADRVARYADGKAIAATWPSGELITTTGLGHFRILQDAHVIDRVVAHLSAGVRA